MKKYHIIYKTTQALHVGPDQHQLDKAKEYLERAAGDLGFKWGVVLNRDGNIVASRKAKIMASKETM